MKERVVPSKKWEPHSIDILSKIADPSHTLSFKQELEIEKHAFGTLEFHRNGGSRSVGEILANEKCAVMLTDPIRFKRGKITKSFSSSFLKF